MTENRVRVIVADCYPACQHRLSKDTNGGYGTANDLGDAFVARFLKGIVANSIDWAPLHCAYTAGVLRQAGHFVQYTRDAADLDPGAADLFLLTSSIVGHETELAVAARLVEAGAKVGMIGPFATAVPQPYLDIGAFVISGEPEMFFHNTPLTGASIARLDGVVPAGTAPLDDLPFPAWDLIAETRHPKFGLLGGGATALPIIATRGCPYSCFQYCVYPLQQGRKVRHRSPASIVAEMLHWNDRLGAEIFVFRDPVFAINRDHAFALFDAIRTSGRRFRLVVETHLNNIDEEMARQMRLAGVEMVKVGIEGADPEILRQNSRFSLPIDRERSRLDILKREGLQTTCMFIFGFPQDTVASVRATIDFACRLNPTIAQFSVFTPYPGTPAFAQFEKRIIVDRFEAFTQYHLVFRHDHLDPSQVRALLDEAYRKFYTRPTWLLRTALNKLRRTGARRAAWLSPTPSGIQV